MPHETDVPLVAWGAGIRRPNDEEQQNKVEELAQADIAPLMSSLLGVGVPKNSAGRLPAQLLSLPSPSSLVEASCAVARQAFEMLATLRRKFDKQLVHRPFSQMDKIKFDEVMKVKLINYAKN